MKTHKNSFDIIIAGGGLSGCLMALSLASLTKADGDLLSIAIVEANDIQHSSTNNLASPVFDDRVLALSHGSAAYLKQLGAWQHLADDACAIAAIDISDRGHYGKARLAAKAQQVQALGYVIDMALIGKSLFTELAHKPNVHWFCPDSINDINWRANNENTLVSVTLDSGKQLSAGLLLACDGANSPCRQLAGIHVSRHDYQQVAVIANVSTQKNHQNKAFERFTEFGPIAMLPLSDLRVSSNGSKNSKNRCSLVWTMSVEQSEALALLNDSDFAKQLEQNFGGWLGDITHVGKRDTYPLSLLQAEQQYYHRMALLGNASHTLHPIAGQGFNLGLRDVQLMAKLVTQNLQASGDIGSFAMLNEYAQQRQKDQQQIITLTDALVTLFANDLPPLVVGRNIGLSLMNVMPPIKHSLVHQLMGY